MLIKIKSVEEKERKEGGIFKVITSDKGNKFYLFDESLWTLFQPGVTVNCTVTGDKYKHIVAIEEGESEPEPKPNGLSKDRQIARLACLKPAAAIMAARIAKGDEIKSSDLFKLAGLMEKWATGELDTLEKPKEADASKQGS